MLIDEQFRKCVTFLFVDKPDSETQILKKTPAASAFFVGVPVENAGSVIYATTARHVIDASRPYGPLYIRINTLNGGFQDVSTSQDSWVSHPSTDVALIHLAVPTEGFDLRAIPFSMLATDEYVINKKIGAGDDVFFVGLFSEYPGHERNQPIIRFGNISLMPHEKIRVRLDPSGGAPVPIDAYLVEARSWGGHSGSPAFVYFPPDRHPGMLMLGGTNEFALLGLVQGHHEIKQEVAFIGDILGTGKVPINAGIAVVVPSQKIIDLLMQEEPVEERKRILEESQERTSVPRPDSITEPPLKLQEPRETLKRRLLSPWRTKP